VVLVAVRAQNAKPTGHVALEQVLRLAVAELGVKPLRTDWSEVLGGTQTAFEEWRSWPASGKPQP
jgi:hypothetical protein